MTVVLQYDCHNSIADRKSMFDGGTNCGSRTWSGGTIGGTVFGPAGPLAARTTCGVTVPQARNSIKVQMSGDIVSTKGVLQFMRFGKS